LINTSFVILKKYISVGVRDDHRKLVILS